MRTKLQDSYLDETSFDELFGTMKKDALQEVCFWNSSTFDSFTSVESLLIASIWCYFIINDSLNNYLLKTVFFFVFQFNLIPLDDAVTKEVHEEFYQKLNLDLDALRSSLKQLNDSNDPQSSASHITQISFVGLFAVVVLLFYSCWRFYWNYCLIFKIHFVLLVCTPCTSFFSLIVKKVK